MKVIKLELHTLPDSYKPRSYEVLRYPKIKPIKMTNLENLDYADTMEVTRDLYDLQALALGNYYQEFFIRKQDMDALLNFLDGFVNKARVDQLNQILNVGNQASKKVLLRTISEMKKVLEKDTYERN